MPSRHLATAAAVFAGALLIAIAFGNYDAVGVVLLMQSLRFCG